MNYNQECYDDVLNKWKKSIIESIEDNFDNADELIEEINDVEDFSDLIVFAVENEYWLLEDLEDVFWNFLSEVRENERISKLSGEELLDEIFNNKKE